MNNLDCLLLELFLLSDVSLLNFKELNGLLDVVESESPPSSVFYLWWFFSFFCFCFFSFIFSLNVWFLSWSRDAFLVCISSRNLCFYLLSWLFSFTIGASPFAGVPLLLFGVLSSKGVTYVLSSSLINFYCMRCLMSPSLRTF